MPRLYPSMTDYAAAVQNPGATFRLPALAQASFATMPPLGLPAIASGQNAVVFTANIGATTTAVRCFTTECADGRHRYQSLEQHRRTRDVPAMAKASWVDDAIELNGDVWPVVTMDWVHGEQLHEYVALHKDNPAVIAALADAWVDTCASLRDAEVAHGDLQHGNVIIEDGGAVRLIDFDGIWVRDVASSPPSEVGHPNYQHPARKDTGAWGWSIDWFSALGVLVSLRALASDTSLWDLHMGENLIFREEDFWGDAPVWDRLERSSDLDVRNWSQLLAEACAHEPDAPYDLPTILNHGLVASDGSTATTTATRPTETGAEPAAETSSVGAWWNTVVDDDGSGTAEPVARPEPQPSAATGGQTTVNADWPGTGAAGAPPTSMPPGDGGSTGARVRPPQRERPEEHAVHSNWSDPTQPDEAGGPHPAGVAPPTLNRPISGSRLPPPGGPPKERPRLVSILGYVLLGVIIFFVFFGLSILTGGGN